MNVLVNHNSAMCQTSSETKAATAGGLGADASRRGRLIFTKFLPALAAPKAATSAMFAEGNARTGSPAVAG